MSQQSSQSLCLCDLLLLLFAKRAFEVALLATMHLAMFFPLSVSLSLSLTVSPAADLSAVWWNVQCVLHVPNAALRYHYSVTSQSPRHVEHIDFHHTI